MLKKSLNSKEYALENKSFTLPYKFIYLLLLAVPALILGFYINYSGAYVYWIFPQIQQGINTGFLDADSLASPGYAAFLIVMSELLGTSPVATTYLPIGTILYTVTMFALATLIFSEKKYVYFLTFYAAWDSTLIANYNATFYSLSHPLFIVCLILILKIDKLKKIDTSTLICIVLLYLGVFYVHPESPLWMILSIIGMNVSLLLLVLFRRDIKIEKSNIQHQLIYLTVAMIIIYLFLNRLVFTDWMPRVDNIDMGDTVSAFVSSKLNPSVDSNEYSGQIFNGYYNYSRIVQYLLMFGLIFAGFINYLKNWRSKKSMSSENIFSFNIWVILFLIAIIDTILYSIEGWVSLKFINLMFPILAILSVRNFKISERKKDILLVLFSLVVIISSIGLMSELFEKSSTTHEDIEPSASWILTNSIDNPTILADVPTYTKILVQSSLKDISFVHQHYTLEIYKAMVEYSANSQINEGVNHYDYIFIDTKGTNKAIETVGNRHFEPLSKYSTMIDNNRGLNKVYWDNQIVILYT